jgi:Zn-dependent protease
VTGVDSDTIVLGLTWFVVFLFSTTLHEAGHAFAAWRLGDPTAYEGGQVSLNPLPHIQREPFGMILVPLITFALSGWMMGWASAPYDPHWAHNYPKRAGVMAMAGPAANLILVLISGLLIRVGIAAGWFYVPNAFSFTQIVAGQGWAEGAAAPLSILFMLNLLLFVFNLLPVPPLDGSAILPMFLSDSANRRYQEILHMPMLSLLGLLIAWKVFPYIFQPISILALRMLYPGLL